MEKRAIMRSANAVLPAVGFAPETLLAPRQALVAYFSRVEVVPTGTEHVAVDEAAGRVLAQTVAAAADYPVARRSTMDGFALNSALTPGAFTIAGEVAMGAVRTERIDGRAAVRIPTGGVLPDGSDTVLPIEEARLNDGRLIVEAAILAGDNVVHPGADMRAGETLLEPGRRLRPADCGLLATLGITEPMVYRRPRIAVLSSGDELIEPQRDPEPGQIRDSNRYAIAASLRAMGAEAIHFPTLRDEAAQFESALSDAVAQCDAVVVSGGSSVGERDRLPAAVAAIGTPGVVVHGLRVKPGKPALLGASGGKPILGLPGNPASALFILEAVASPIVGALTGALLEPAMVQARLAGEARSRSGWTWYIPVRLQHEAPLPVAHPLGVRSFSVSLAARADGYITMEERDEVWPAGTVVSVRRFFSP
jgi:molybdenum cofactor synthesis domain-containing protein